VPNRFISTSDIEFDVACQTLAKLSSADIRRRMFEAADIPLYDTFAEIENEVVLGEIARCEDLREHQPITQFEPIRRLLGKRDQRFLEAQNALISDSAIAMHRRMLHFYADELAHDIEALWKAKQMAGAGKEKALWAWRAKAYWLLGKLTTAALLHGMKLARASKIADGALTALEIMTTAARAEILQRFPNTDKHNAHS